MKFILEPDAHKVMELDGEEGTIELHGQKIITDGVITGLKLHIRSLQGAPLAVTIKGKGIQETFFLTPENRDWVVHEYEGEWSEDDLERVEATIKCLG